ncbi:hypothetical protein SLA2020_116130 [Shorea laevis]
MSSSCYLHDKTHFSSVLAVSAAPYRRVQSEASSPPPPILAVLVTPRMSCCGNIAFNRLFSPGPSPFVFSSKPCLLRSNNFRVFFYSNSRGKQKCYSSRSWSLQKASSLRICGGVRTEAGSGIAAAAMEGSKVGKRTDLKKITILGWDRL